jgi:hypothetical protein
VAGGGWVALAPVDLAPARRTRRSMAGEPGNTWGPCIVYKGSPPQNLAHAGEAMHFSSGAAPSSLPSSLSISIDLLSP